MKERSISLDQYEIPGVLSGRKTQLRRLVKPQPVAVDPRNCRLPGLYRTGDFAWRDKGAPAGCVTISCKPHGPDGWADANSPYGGPGDRLAFNQITLEVISVRVERLQDISESDSIAEGAPWASCGSSQEGSHKAGFAKLWESINGPGSWVANPWVWVIEFKRIEQGEQP